MTAGRKKKERPETLPENSEREIQRRRDLGMRIRECRERRGWSLRDLAAASGLHHNNLLAIEQGTVDAKVGTITGLAQALECEEAWLLLGGRLQH